MNIPPREELAQWKGLTNRQVAEKYGVSTRTLLRWKHILGLVRPKKQKPKFRTKRDYGQATLFFKALAKAKKQAHEQGIRLDETDIGRMMSEWRVMSGYYK